MPYEVALWLGKSKRWQQALLRFNILYKYTVFYVENKWELKIAASPCIRWHFSSY
jgi:hypothetical protein